MSLISRYYVDDNGIANSNIVIRDRMSPMAKQAYPTDIASALTMGMFPSREKTLFLADKICKILNEEL